MNRRDFIRSMFAAGVAVVAAPLMPARVAPALDAGARLTPLVPTLVEWFEDVNCDPDRIYGFYGAPQRVFGSMGPWFRSTKPAEGWVDSEPAWYDKNSAPIRIHPTRYPGLRHDLTGDVFDQS
jgi:hypothetical protein